MSNIRNFPNYKIFEDGTIKNIKFNRDMKIKINNKGYKSISLYNGKYKGFLVHRLLALAYIPNPENKECIDHIDRNKLNNNLNNLRWVTRQENNQNLSLCKRNKLGISNISYSKRDKLYYYQKMINYKSVRKSFKTLEEAKEFIG